MASPTMLDNGTKFDIASWTNWTAVNVTQYVPSARDFALAGPRMVMKLGSFLAVPESVDNILGIRMASRIIPEATGSGIPDPAETITAAAVAGITQIVETSSETLTEENIMESSRFSLESARSLGGLFAYATSKWALGCIVMAIVLNRTHIMASTRRPLEFTWKPRFLLRIIPIILLLFQARWLLQSIQCQTSPDFGYLRWGNSSKSHNLLFTQDGGPLHTFSQALLFGAKDSSSCLAVSMIPSNHTVGNETNSEEGIPTTYDLSGSLSLLWPLFKTFSFSQFVETVSCAVQGRQVAAETGMTLFEHSLAFAEADAAISAQIVGFTKIKIPAEDNSNAGPTQFPVTRSMILKKINTTPEVLLVGFLSVMNHLSSHILAIFDIQGRYRLLSTGFWGISFMSVIVWSLVSFSFDHPSSQALLRFPTVCIIGFIPHVLVLCGIIICSIIYGVALILSTLAPASGIDESNIPVGQNLPDTPRPRLSFSQRVINAHHNMQANVPLSSIRITMHMDFYTALLRTGFAVMTMASEAVYLNESRGVNVKPNTWLEDDRLREIEETGAQWLGPSFKAHESELAIDDHMPHNVGLVAATNQRVLPQKNNSPYAREMTAQKNAKSKGQERSVRDGVGATERSGRWVMALEFFLGINRLILSWWATCILMFMSWLGIQSRPGWLLWLVSRTKRDPASTVVQANDPDTLNFWLLNMDGELTLPKDDHVDVEVEMRRRLKTSQEYWSRHRETELDSSLYQWWLNGGWWGSDDNSGTFSPEKKDIEDDMTSVISYSTEDERDWESDDAVTDGQRTPTQRSPHPSRESSPFLDTPLSTTDLAQLLHPRNPEQRAEAQALSLHLSSDKILTRSRYRDIIQRERAHVLTSTLQRPPNFIPSDPSGKLSPDEEAQILEHLIISKRNYQKATQEPASWMQGASGMGENGPQCVVCQSSPRSVIVWPCRCLSLCDDCRVTLAMNNFDKCVCCRRDVVSFSRIFVP
ncbi:uncharacterized protein EAE97_004867 [Botrytis byssoidea]|uniref:Uncharacterized protein n=1 Tax=Botrytis byssoidea TaxID=139641 RepID=A0A9P5LVL3_9HELO|nr:uncharacterized protein EAE97_004867 [Botrytis byssoidea]KAF7945829.1 hypothetical protein EAE97_004867 [Botrytis byssoidea]